MKFPLIKIKDALQKNNALFLLLLTIHLGISIYLIASKRLVACHDGFQYFSQQYYFLNNVIMSPSHGIPQWVPYMTHGTVATWWYSIQAGLLQSVLLLTRDLLKSVNFLPVYVIGIFIDQLLLLAGTWLLARRLFSSDVTAFFVSATVMGSTIWMSQIWWNFHFYYAIPLILYFGHCFLETGRWRYFFLGGNLLAIQTMGNLPYFISVTTMILFLYFISYISFNFKETKEQFSRIRINARAWLSILSVACSLLTVYKVLKIGAESITNYNAGRQSDGSVDLFTFLTYAGNTDMTKWLELFIGVSPGLDYTLFIGYLPLALIILGIFFNRGKKYYHLIFVFVILILFSAGSFVATFFYYFWPLMKFYRHLALVSPVIKLFLCFIAGIGFEYIFLKNPDKKSPYPLLVTSAVLFTCSVILFTLSHKYSFTAKLFDIFISSRLPDLKNLLTEDYLHKRIILSSVYAFLTYLVIGFLPIFPIEKFRKSIIGLALILHLFNIYEYHLQEIHLRTSRLSDSQYTMMSPQEITFVKKRDLAFWPNNPRASLVGELSIPHIIYWSTHPFLFKDQIGNPFRTDHWLKPFDKYMKIYWHQPLDKIADSPAGPGDSPVGWTGNLIFPMNHPAALKMSGYTEDKIQFFSQAYLGEDEARISEKIGDHQYKGDVLFVSTADSINTNILRSIQWAKDAKLSASDRLYYSYDVQKFSSNMMDVLVNIPDRDSVWMLYSDVWHPLWEATINKQPVQVFQANLAYKAVQLKQGLNEIRFSFQSRLLNVLYHVLGVNALLWVGIILFYTKSLCFWRDPDK